jgi:hypothetical protein
MYVFFLTVQKNLQDSKSLLIFSTPKATRFYELSRPIGFRCFFFQKEYILSIHLSLWKFTSKVKKVILLTKIWVFSVMWSKFWGCRVYCHCFNVCISSSRLCKVEMFWYVILWRLSSWPNLNHISCIIIIYQVWICYLWWFQCNWKLDDDAVVF